METQNKKSLKGLWIIIAVIALLAVGAWVVYSGIEKGSVDSVFSLSTLLVGIFIITVYIYSIASG